MSDRTPRRLLVALLFVLVSPLDDLPAYFANVGSHGLVYAARPPGRRPEGTARHRPGPRRSGRRRLIPPAAPAPVGAASASPGPARPAAPPASGSGPGSGAARRRGPAPGSGGRRTGAPWRRGRC